MASANHGSGRGLQSTPLSRATDSSADGEHTAGLETPALVSQRAGLNRTRLAIVGCVGVPNVYGGFESFAEHVSPALRARGLTVTVTCDRARYVHDLSPDFKGVRRLFIRMPANGALSPLHDLLAFVRVVFSHDTVLVLGVSGGLFFPLFWLLALLSGSRVLVNIDGVEWRRTKFQRWRRRYLYLSDWLAQRFAHQVIYDNLALKRFLHFPAKSHCIAYSGDHAAVAPAASTTPGWTRGSAASYALTVCRIEPENNCEMLIQGFLASRLGEYRFVGNWSASDYGRALRAKYAHEPRLRLMDPVYEAGPLHTMRQGCSHYLHGHAVGGTNPSLVEMLYFDCHILCFDCDFNRCTAETAAMYFRRSDDLKRQLDKALPVSAPPAHVRERYTLGTIVEQLTGLMGSVPGRLD